MLQGSQFKMTYQIVSFSGLVNHAVLPSADVVDHQAIWIAGESPGTSTHLIKRHNYHYISVDFIILSSSLGKPVCYSNVIFSTVNM